MDHNVVVTKTASNANELEAILKFYENNEDDYNFDNRLHDLSEDELENYVIDRTHSKDNYFLCYKEEKAPHQLPKVKNVPLQSKNFLSSLHAQVASIESRQAKVEEF